MVKFGLQNTDQGKIKTALLEIFKFLLVFFADNNTIRCFVFLFGKPALERMLGVAITSRVYNETPTFLFNPKHDKPVFCKT